MQCRKCVYWGDGNGTGIRYDAGHMNVCNHPGVHGMQHPSYGAYGEQKTMLYAGGEQQIIQTRWDFGCVLYQDIFDKLKK